MPRPASAPLWQKGTGALVLVVCPCFTAVLAHSEPWWLLFGFLVGFVAATGALTDSKGKGAGAVAGIAGLMSAPFAALASAMVAYMLARHGVGYQWYLVQLLCLGFNMVLFALLQHWWRRQNQCQ